MGINQTAILSSPRIIHPYTTLSLMTTIDLHVSVYRNIHSEPDQTHMLDSFYRNLCLNVNGGARLERTPAGHDLLSYP